MVACLRLRSPVFASSVFTFVLCFVVLNVAVKDGRKHVFGSRRPGYSESDRPELGWRLAIAFCIVAGGNAIGMVSGGSLNPAVSFGIDSRPG